jgi:F0F1-type ATP synthase beta subunit
MYVSCETAKELNKEKIVNKIIDQKESLKNIIVLLQDSKLSEESKFVLNDLKQIFDAFEVAETNTVKNLETIKSILDKVGNLRQKLVAGA